MQEPFDPTVARGVALLVVGAGLLAASWLAWSGRWRGWAKDFVLGTWPVTLLPGLGGIAAGVGLAELSLATDTTLGAVVGIVSLALGGVALAAGTVLGFWEPEWFGPGWYRERAPEEHFDPSTTTNRLAATALAKRPQVSSRQQVADHLPEEHPRHTWRGSWVHDQEAEEAAHGRGPQAANGRLDGSLLVYDSGVGFAASATEERLRQGSAGFFYPREELSAVRTVPAHAGADGVVRERLGVWSTQSSPWRRLVIDTVQGSLVLQVGNARGKARRLAALYGLAAPEVGEGDGD